MAGFNGSGTFVRSHDWTTDKTNLVAVTASRMDTEDDGFATGLSSVICKDGQTATTARIPFASGTSAAAGAVSGASYAQTGDLNTGLYFPAADEWGLTAGGTATLTSTATVVTCPVDLKITGDIFPTASDGAALGSASLMWSDLFLASGAVINFNNGDVTATHAANALSFEGGTVKFDTAPTPTSSDAAALGTSSVMWADLFLASGAVINFNNGDVTLTHSADTLTVAGGTFATAALTATTIGGTNITGSGAISGATATGAMIATQAEQETGSATDKLVTPGRQHFHQSAAKAWGRLDGTGTAALEAPDWNIGSITDNGTGDFTFTLSITLSGTTYTVAGSAGDNGETDRTGILSPTAYGATSLRVLTGSSGTGSAVPQDLDFVNIAIFGDI